MRWLLILILATSALACGRQSQTTACKSNLKNLATALEMWSSDHGGRYPKRLDLLIPTYLKEIPQCPAAQRDTYSLNYRCQSQPDTFALCCTGSNHPVLKSPNRPAYTAEFGLVDLCSNKHHSAASCLANLTQVGQALECYRQDRGKYPDELAQLVPAYLGKLPDNPPDYSGKGRIDCPDFAHGYQRFHWTPSGGVQTTRLKPLSYQPPPENRNLALTFALSLLIIAWSLARQASRGVLADATAPPDPATSAIQRHHRGGPRLAEELQSAPDY